MAEDTGSRTLAYGGYRFANDLAVEAAVATFDRYALRPSLAGARRGVGLCARAGRRGAGKAWNVDVYTTWEFRNRFSLYGRLGYAQTRNAACLPAGVQRATSCAAIATASTTASACATT